MYIALALAGFTVAFGTRHLDATERHEGMVAAIAFESVVKLMAFMAVGLFVSFWLFSSPAALFEQARAVPALRELLQFGQGQPFAYAQWLGLTLLAMLSVIFLPRQFQVMVVENVDEQHLRRAVWAFPLYLFLINLFVLPIAYTGLQMFPPGAVEDIETQAMHRLTAQLPMPRFETDSTKKDEFSSPSCVKLKVAFGSARCASGVICP